MKDRRAHLFENAPAGGVIYLEAVILQGGLQIFLPVRQWFPDQHVIQPDPLGWKIGQGAGFMRDTQGLRREPQDAGVIISPGKDFKRSFYVASSFFQ